MNCIRILPKLVTLIILMAMQGCNGNRNGGHDDSGATRVYEVTDITLAILKSYPPQLQIMAKGKVTSSGWKKPQLKQFVYIQPPPDGIYDFDFVAVPPDGPALTVITDIKATYVVAPMPSDLKGVRIHAKRNKLEAMVDGAR